MPRFPHICDVKQYWIQKMKEMWFWVKNFKICQKSPKTGKSYHGSYMYSKIIWNETERTVGELLW
jgi:hypothetical protein